MVNLNSSSYNYYEGHCLAAMHREDRLMMKAPFIVRDTMGEIRRLYCGVCTHRAYNSGLHRSLAIFNAVYLSSVKEMWSLKLPSIREYTLSKKVLIEFNTGRLLKSIEERQIHFITYVYVGTSGWVDSRIVPWHPSVVGVGEYTLSKKVLIEFNWGRLKKDRSISLHMCTWGHPGVGGFPDCPVMLWVLESTH